MKSLFNKILSFFDHLISRPRVGGLQITDSSIQYVYLVVEGNPVATSVQLPPGVVSGGIIRDRSQFEGYLRHLHNSILPRSPKEKIRAVVCLPSAISYTQEFSLPNVGKGERLEESVMLNMQMISPIPPENVYMSWHVLNETEDKLEILGAFAERSVVDGFKKSLEAANFQPIIFEFPSLALSWTMYRAFGKKAGSQLVLSVSSDGMDLVLLRNNLVYFDYFRSWQSIQGQSRQISKSAFESVVVEEVRKVVNFTTTRFQENLQSVFFIAPGLEQSVQEIISKNFGFKAVPFQVQFGRLGPSWYTVIGSAIRGSWAGAGDKFISLGTERVEDIFYREQVRDFIRLWRNMFGVFTVMFLLIFASAAIILGAQPESLRDRLSILNVEAQRGELVALREQAEEFNGLIQAINKVREGSQSMSVLLDDVRKQTQDFGIILDSLNFGAAGGTVSLTARAPDHNTVIEFKNALVLDSGFENVNLPLSKISVAEGNFVSFEINFNIVSD